MKKIFLTIIAVLMVFSSTSINVSAVQEQTVSEDVKIELIQNNNVVETGMNKLVHNRNYVRSSNKTNGDEIVITAPEGVHYLMVQLDKYCGTPKITGTLEEEQVEGSIKPSNMASLEYEETLVYLINNEFRFTIPGITGTDANGNTLGGGNWPYDSRAFSTSGNTEKVITARVATEEEINARRNLALNPFDLRGNDNGVSGSNKKGDISVFPHAYANRVTDNKREFEPRNAIDGFEFNASHVGFPYQAWGCGNEKTDSEFSVLFGRYVEIDQIDITVRAQWNPPQPNNANDHDINWTSATLEFSDGTEMPISLQKLASPQVIKLPEKKVVSWVRLKDLPVSEETIPGDGRKKFSALTEFKVWGVETDNSNVDLPSAQNLVNLAKKVNDYWIKTGGNTGDDATNYNHGHSISSEFWAPSVFYTGNMEAYYLTGDENYTDYANRWGSNNIYNDQAWNTKADSGRIGKYFPDNHTSFQTYLDMFSITSDSGFDPDDEKLRNLVPIMNEMEQMSISDLKNKNGYWDRIDFFYMELPNWTKMYLLTGEEKWLDKLRELYDDRKAELYDEETGLFYRDKNYIFDADATYNPDSNGNNQKISPNGKKILWSRGNGWAMGALAKILQDLPDDRTNDKEEYETVFKKMAATLLKTQGEDGFWRMNLDDYDHDIRPETSGTVFFAYGLAWGINNGLLDRDTYYPAVKKAFLGLNANAIRPDGLVGRSELISAYPNPNCSLGIGSSQSYAPAATVMFLSELSKLENQGYVTDDVEPALNKKMIGSVAVKEDSKYAVVNSRIRELVPGSDLKTIKYNDEIYVPEAFVKEVYGINDFDGILTYSGVNYVALSVVLENGSNRKLSVIENDIAIISYKTNLFNEILDSKLIDLLTAGLINGKYLDRPEYPIRFDYTEPPEEPVPSEDALISVEANSAGAVSANRLIGPNTENLVNIEFDMITVLSPSQTNAIVGLGSSDSNYTAYSQVPIIIRMFNDGRFSVYNGTGYVQSAVKFTENEKYHLRISVDLEAKRYSVFVSGADGIEVAIADNYAFRSTAKAIENIGKIYLFNNDQAAGKYWLEDIYLGIKTDKEKLENILAEAKEYRGDKYTEESFEILQAVIKTGEIILEDNEVTQEQVNAMILELQAAISGLELKEIITTNKTALSIAVEMASNVTELDKVVPVVVIEFKAALQEAQTILADESVSQEEVDASFARLSVAMHMLQFYKGEKSELQDLIVQVEGLDENKFTVESWQTLVNALQEAKEVNDNENAMQEEVDEAIKNLQAAIDNLEEVKEVDKSLLEAMINKVLGLDGSRYTDKTWNDLIPVLQEAQEVLANESASQEEVDNAYNALVKAYLELRLIPDKSLLQELIDKAQSLDGANYSAKTWNVVVKALGEAKEVLDNFEASQAEVDNAKDTLAKAMAKLRKVDTVKTEATVSVATGDNVPVFEWFVCGALLSLIFMLKKVKF